MDIFVPEEIYINLLKMLEHRAIDLIGAALKRTEITSALGGDGYIIIKGKYRATSLIGVQCVSTSPVATRGEHLYVLYLSADREFKGANIEKIINGMKITGSDLLVVGKQSSYIDKKIADIKKEAKTSYVEFAPHYIFLRYLPSHVYCVPHEIVAAAEIEKFCADRKTRVNYLQLILSGDPMAIWIGLRPGQVVKILRASESCGEIVAYRYCNE